MIELAPRTVQNMPDCFRREPITVLQPHFNHTRADEQMLTAKVWISHTLGISLKVFRLSASLFQRFGIG